MHIIKLYKIINFKLILTYFIKNYDIFVENYNIFPEKYISEKFKNTQTIS